MHRKVRLDERAHEVELATYLPEGPRRRIPGGVRPLDRAHSPRRADPRTRRCARAAPPIPALQRSVRSHDGRRSHRVGGDALACRIEPRATHAVHRFHDLGECGSRPGHGDRDTPAQGARHDRHRKHPPVGDSGDPLVAPASSSAERLSARRSIWTSTHPISRSACRE